MDNSFPIVIDVVVTQQPLDAQRESLKPHIQSLLLAGSKQGILYLLFPSIRWWKVFLFLFNENAMIQSRFPSTPKRAIIARSIPSTTKPKLLLGSSSVFSDNIILVLFKRFLTSTRMSILIWNWFPNYIITYYIFCFLTKIQRGVSEPHWHSLKTERTDLSPPHYVDMVGPLKSHTTQGEESMIFYYTVTNLKCDKKLQIISVFIV